MAVVWVWPPFGVSARWIIGWSLFLAYSTGPGLAFRDVASRAVAVLPVSWRDRWRSPWIMAVLVPLGVTVIGQLAGLAIARMVHLPNGDLSVVLLSTLCTAAYVGYAMALHSLLKRERKGGRDYRPLDPRTARIIIFRTLIEIGGIFLLVFLGGLSGALFYQFMPADLAALRGLTGAVIAVGIGTGVWTWFFWSSLGARPEILARVPTGLPRPQATSTPLPVEPRGAVGVRGLFAWGFVKACKHALVCAAIAVPFLFLIENRDAVKVGWVTLVFFVGGVDWQTRLRPLRQLPISTFMLNLAMLSTIITPWVVTVPLMVVAHFIEPSRFDALPVVPIFSVVIAVNALGQSMQLRKKRTDLAFVLAGFLALRVVPKAVWDAVPSISHGQVVWLSVAAIALAMFVSHHTLMRSSTAYKPRTALGFPFGAPQTR